MKVLVTGSLGFIGRRLGALLRSRGFSVIGTTKYQKTPRDESTVWLDLANPISIERAVIETNPDVVVHCAGIAIVRHPEPSEYYKINAIGTELLLNALSKLGKRRFIFVSTAGVYGNQTSPVLHEEMVALPVHHYGCSKYVAERFVDLRRDTLDISTLRLFNLIGPNQSKDFLVPKLVDHFFRRAPAVKLGNLNVRRDFADLDFICQSIIEIISMQNTIGETINVCSGQATSLLEIITTLTDLTGHRIEIEPSEELVRKNEIWNLVGSTAKFERLVTNRPKLMSLADSLKWALTEHSASPSTTENISSIHPDPLDMLVRTSSSITLKHDGTTSNY